MFLNSVCIPILLSPLSGVQCSARLGSLGNGSPGPRRGRFRRAGLGPLIGKRSWGVVVGITNRGTLVDGGTVYVPEFGTNAPDGRWVGGTPELAPDGTWVGSGPEAVPDPDGFDWE